MPSLEHIKPGDKIAHEAPRSYRLHMNQPRVKHTILLVERVTATQVVCTNGERFRIKDARAVGEGKYYHAIPATDEMLDTNARERDARYRYLAAWSRAGGLIEALEKRTVDTDKLERLLAEWGGE